MALPSSGTIKMSQVRDELKKTGPISLGNADVRKLGGKPSGTIKMSDLYGKSAINYKILLDANLTIGKYTDNNTYYGYHNGWDGRTPAYGNLDKRNMSNGLFIQQINSTEGNTVTPLSVSILVSTDAPDNFTDFIFEICGVEDVPIRRISPTYFFTNMECLKVFEFCNNVGKTVRIRIKQVVN